MSKFYTAIAVDLEGLRKGLPKDSFVHGVTFNEAESRLELHWEHDGYSTGLDHPTEFNADDFTEEEPEPSPAASPAEKSAEPTEPAKAGQPKPAKAAKAVRTRKAKAAARAKG